MYFEKLQIYRDVTVCNANKLIYTLKWSLKNYKA